MKITKSQLKQIIKEEIEKTLNEDVLDYIEDGDTILVPVGNILLKPDGRVIFSAKDRDGKALGDILTQANDETVQKLRGGGTLEPEQMDPFGRDVLVLIDKMKQAYEGGEMPPQIGEIEREVKKAPTAKGLAASPLKSEIVNIWNNLLRWHQSNRGVSLPHDVTRGFNDLNTLLRKV